jgi:hypothetical protein
MDSTEEQYTKSVQEAFSSMDQLVDKCWEELRRKTGSRKVILRNLRALLYDEAQSTVELLRTIQATGMAVHDANGDAHRILGDAMEVVDYLDQKIKKGIKSVPKE